MYIVDRDNGEAILVYLFVDLLPFSMCAYAEGCLRMDMENWIMSMSICSSTSVVPLSCLCRIISRPV